MAITVLTAQSSSTSYVLDQQTVNGGGNASTSASFRLAFSLGQGESVGASSAPGHLVQVGFWSFVGSGPVPIVLAVDRASLGGEAVLLNWSGNEASYEIYAATDCANVFDFFHVAETGNSHTVLPPEAELVCFNVISMVAPPPRLALP
jgi:hypothetical protein